MGTPLISNRTRDLQRDLECVSATPTRSARGYLGHKRPTSERADLAARDYVQKRSIEAPTLQQLAFGYRVSVASVRRRLNGNGRPSNGRNGHRETLAEHIARSTAEERLAAARIVGPAEIWDTMISPVVSEERAAETTTTA
jgi:hypothetical protein